MKQTLPDDLNLNSLHPASNRDVLLLNLVGLPQRVCMLFLFLLLTTFAIAQHSQDFAGSWFWESPDGQNTMELQLEYENQKTIKGNHCVTFNQGKKTDCKRKNAGTFTINLVKIAEGVYDGTIESAVSFTSGKIRLQYIDREKAIQFRLKKVPPGEFYMPKEAFLIR
ncbi:hypothetical protein [Salegentibacter sp. Hel_I_6]|uniref:hypothetical protein n=1 Tax=Salegentibacter sp. Hel_I_6 TaxID=1250278 RepID=UPI0005634F78|nr:hypothetical protein [Salegentibacter sp. Hel_I_6]